ncbi:hypothetical protein DL766_007065 [Monosporascus sp. MC13-8B]|uniref:O-methyltransferase C-terminal domain-containing protein n=1 Tax=Monosporascus cannonballus TaxID=155416 RepID=A0ABY0GSS2_9PEZI|nr:hypothetical protein DL762_009877 [Monosporascus cannonballus]RYO96764.1 hypothetical protein DL763_003040 [Monosporascus cannonballus]RYP25409.1 hypothetical protein DL766_007065 [Monosporascus sp. MC13-8B]
MPSKLDTVRMLELASTIQKQVTELQELLSAQDSIPASAEKERVSIELPKEAFTARDSILDATSELYDSLLDPLTLLFQKGAAYALANDATQSIYGVLQSDPVRALRFSSAMKAYASTPELDVSYVLDHYDWGALGKAQVIDIGGARGHVAIEIAKRFPNLQVLVQDRSDSIVGADAELPAELKQRVKFAAHDFFTPQTVTAQVYYFRWVMHNWSDKYCIIILRALIPALRPDARILIQDTCMPEPGTIARWREKDLRAADLNMLALFNARERSAREWGALLARADAKFVLKGVIEPPGSSLALIDIRWDCTG